nr:M17 family peptidase N-terminal domain-containing protein [Actinomadura namibiensis]
MTVTTSIPASPRVDCIVVGAAPGPEGPVPAPGADAVDEAFGGVLAGTLRLLGMTGAAGETVKVPAPAGLAADVVLAVGLGDAAGDVPAVEALRRAAGAAARALAGTGRAVLALPADTAETAQAVATGAVLGAYAFTAYRTLDDGRAPVAELAILTPERTRADTAAGVHRGAVIGEETNRARDRVADAATRSGEQAWPMPLPTDLRASLDSPVADIANTGERMGGALVAGLFLREFVPDGVPWAHLDIAGPAYHEGAPHGYTPAGGTGAAVRTLVRLAEDAAEGRVR